MKYNPDKCHLLVYTRNPFFINIGGHIIFNSTEEKLLGIEIDSQLLVENHVSTLCKKLVKSYMLFQELLYDLEKREYLMKTL